MGNISLNEEEYITSHSNTKVSAILQVVANGAMKSEGLKRGLQSIESCDYQMSESSMFLYSEKKASYFHKSFLDSLKFYKLCQHMGNLLIHVL